jgi:hypothetical protein
VIDAMLEHGLLEPQDNTTPPLPRPARPGRPR